MTHQPSLPDLVITDATVPAGLLVTATQHAGLRYHDRIALLRVPIRDGAHPSGVTDSAAPPGPRTGR